MASSTAQQEQDFQHFIRAGAPHGSVALQISRFRKHTAASRVAGIADDLLGGEDEGTQAPRGLTLEWVESAGRPLRTLTLHPIGDEVEDQLLPACVSVAFAARAVVHLIARHVALLSSPKVVDTLFPISARPDAGTGSYRDAPPPPPDEALRALVEAGFRVEDPAPRQFHATREQVRKKNPFWLLMLIPIVLFAPALIVIERSLKGVLTMLRGVLRQALRDRRERLSWQVREGTLRVETQSVPGEAMQQTETDVPLRDVLAVSFGPSGAQVRDEDGGRLRVVTRHQCLSLAFAHARPDPPTGSANSKKAPKSSRQAERLRHEGRATRALLEWLAASHLS